MSDDRDLPAGDFASWVIDMQAALRGERGSDVPCDGCTACCTSSQFVHIGPDETDTLAHIPAELLFPAPRMPRGHVLLGYDERGHCPMLIDNRCSIYEHRPQACRTYDCRIFPAAGVRLRDETKALIDQRARRWRFSYPTSDDRARHDAVRAAATFFGEHADSLPADRVPASETQLAVFAVERHDDFLRRRRRAARVILIDESGRVLLFRGGDPARPEAGTWWFTPGGGIDDGESAEDAARREVREETGFELAELGPVVLERRVEFEVEGVRYDQDEVFFTAAVVGFDVDNREWTELEHRLMLEHRWWTRDELANTNDTVFPEGLERFL